MLRDLTRNPSKETFSFSFCDVFKGPQRKIVCRLFTHFSTQCAISVKRLFITNICPSRSITTPFRLENMAEEEQELRIDSACKAAQEFTKLYFETFDLTRHLMHKFYMNEATFAWDGNPAVGKESIQKFFDELPKTVHMLTSLDAQPVYFEAVKGQQTVLVQVAGFITFSSEKEMKGFCRSFLLTAQENKWKIVNDSCRLQIPLNSKPKT